MNKAIGYVRVSTKEQEKSGLSLELQDREIRKYCKWIKVELMEVAIDAGESGKDLNREGIKRVIDVCANKEVGHVVVYRLDRLTRRSRDLMILVEEVFLENKIEFHCIVERIDTTTAIGKCMMSVAGAFSQMERELIGERISDALQQKKVRGEPVGSPPLGYEAVNGKYFRKRKDELQTIKYIKSLKRVGKSLNWIARTLNDQGIPTKRGGDWTAATISYMLSYKNYRDLKKKSV